MVTWLKVVWEHVSFISLDEPVFNFHSALSLCNQVKFVVIFVDLLVLSAQNRFWGFQHHIHSLDDIVDHSFLFVLAHAEDVRYDGVGVEALLENLHRTDYSVGLRNSRPHEFVKFALEIGSLMSRDKEFTDFSAQDGIQLQIVHGCVDSVHFLLEIRLLLLEL